MDFLIIKPRGSTKIGEAPKEIGLVNIKNVTSLNTFIDQQVGKSAVSKRVGDYLFWISNPNIDDEEEESEEGIETAVSDTIDNLTCNLLINETEFAFGNVVVTANLYADPDNKFAGLTEQDVANIMNVFTLSGAYLVEDTVTGEEVAVDSVFDALLSPNGIHYEEKEEVEVDLNEFEDNVPEENYEDMEIEDADPDEFDDLEFVEEDVTDENWVDEDIVEVLDIEELEFENN